MLAVFTHRREGPGRALLLIRGVLIGMFGTLAFFIVLRLGLVPMGLAIAFPIAIAVALAVQALGLLRVRRV